MEYLIFAVILLVIVSYMVFSNDLLHEMFDTTNMGQCMNVYTKSKIGDDVMSGSIPRTSYNCPENVCTYNSNLKKCVPNSMHSQPQYQKYCENESYITNMSEQALCTKVGYRWSNGRCVALDKRTQDVCPDSLCTWTSDSCLPKVDKTNEDYDSVNDYCQHITNISPFVSKETCDSIGNNYNWNALIQQCIPNNNKAMPTLDTCWKEGTKENCNLDSLTDCLWIPKQSLITSSSDITTIPSNELKVMESGLDKLNTEVNKYISTITPYQQKIDKESATALIIKVLDQDDKDRFRLETKILPYSIGEFTKV